MAQLKTILASVFVATTITGALVSVFAVDSTKSASVVTAGAPAGTTFVTLTAYIDPFTTQSANRALADNGVRIDAAAIVEGQGKLSPIAGDLSSSLESFTGKATMQIAVPLHAQAVVLNFTMPDGTVAMAVLPATDGSTTLVNAATTVAAKIVTGVQREMGGHRLPLPLSDILKAASYLNPNQVDQIAGAAKAFASIITNEAHDSSTLGLSAETYHQLRQDIDAATFNAEAVAKVVDASQGLVSKASVSTLVAASEKIARSSLLASALSLR